MSESAASLSKTPTVGVVTIAHGRRRHLDAQAASIARQTRRPDRYVVVDMGGPDPAAVTPRHVTDVTIVADHCRAEDLAPARARNLGYGIADTDITIFLDVDCVAAPTLVADYLRSAAHVAGVYAGPVGYLPPGDHDLTDVAAMTDLADHQAGRPRPGQRRCRAPGHEMFWSLSFAIDRASWSRIGGFDERFIGYGGEDTDFARTAVERNVPIWFCGTAQAFHQYHPTSTPPVQHLDAICRNATTYHDKWGEWSMAGWLRAFADASLIQWAPEASAIIRGTGVRPPSLAP